MLTVLPLSGFLSLGFINVRGCYDMEQTIRAAAGIYPTKHFMVDTNGGASQTLSYSGSSICVT
jgi:hypothetical protein